MTKEQRIANLNSIVAAMFAAENVMNAVITAEAKDGDREVALDLNYIKHRLNDLIFDVNAEIAVLNLPPKRR